MFPCLESIDSYVYDSQVDGTSAAEVLQECLFGKWSKV